MVVLQFTIKDRIIYLAHVFQFSLDFFGCLSVKPVSTETPPNLTIVASPLKKTFVVHPEGKSSSPNAQVFHQPQIVHLLNAGKCFRQ